MEPTVSMKKLPSPLRRSSLIPALAGAVFAASSAPAMAQSDGIVFVDLGRWTIYEMTSAGYCEMRLNSGGGVDLVMRKRAGSPGSLRLSSNRAGRSFGSEIVWAFDEEEYGGSLLDAATFAPSSDSSAIEAAFRRAETLSIRQSGATVASISLKSSSAGFRLLDQCAKQWRTSFIPATPFRMAGNTSRGANPSATSSRTMLSSGGRPDAPARTPSRVPATAPTTATVSNSPAPVAVAATTTVSGSFPPNRALKARDPSSWVRQEDFPSLPNLPGDGVLRFVLQVNKSGLVDECTVLQSSGSRALDRKTCRTIQSRARFDPATDANGNPISATYRSNVKFALP